MSLVLAMLCGCASFFTFEEEVSTEDMSIDQISVLKDITENTLQLSSDGTVLEMSCEDYSEQGIDTNGVEDYIRGEIDAYNKESGLSKMSLVEYREDSGLVKSAIRYNDIDTYNDFNVMDIVNISYDKNQADEVARDEAEARLKAAVTVTEEVEIDEEALAEAGYSLDDLEDGAINESSGEVATASDAVATFTDASGNVAESGDISGDSYMMIKTTEPIVISISDGKILYTNYHVEPIDASSARCLGDGVAIIVYEYNN